MTLGRIVRFGLVGVVNTGTYFCLYLLLHLFTPYLVAHVCAFVLAMVGSYFLNCRFTFRTKPRWRSFLLFPLSNLSNFVLTTAGLYLFVHYLHLDSRWAALPVAVLAVPVTFVVAQFALTSDHRSNARPGSDSIEQTAAP